jgi:hypothetical protein
MTHNMECASWRAQKVRRAHIRREGRMRLLGFFHPERSDHLIAAKLSNGGGIQPEFLQNLISVLSE